jgi:phosphatidylglycerophosphate synthase
MGKIQDIRAIQKRPDGLFGSFMTRPVSPYFVYLAYLLGMSPNVVSILSFVFCLAGAVLFFFNHSSLTMIAASAVLWWIGAILDAADGDLARYIEVKSPFGGWLDSFLDRVKEFTIFSVFGYLAFIQHSNPLYLLAGVISIFTCVMSGYISDTKKLFIKTGERKPELKFSKKYIFGMVDTRDFFVIVAICAREVRIALIVYSTLFLFAVTIQFLKFYRTYGLSKKGK